MYQFDFVIRFSPFDFKYMDARFLFDNSDAWVLPSAETKLPFTPFLVSWYIYIDMPERRFSVTWLTHPICIQSSRRRASKIRNSPEALEFLRTLPKSNAVHYNTARASAYVVWATGIRGNCWVCCVTWQACFWLISKARQVLKLFLASQLSHCTD